MPVHDLLEQSVSEQLSNQQTEDDGHTLLVPCRVQTNRTALSQANHGLAERKSSNSDDSLGSLTLNSREDD